MQVDSGWLEQTLFSMRVVSVISVLVLATSLLVDAVAAKEVRIALAPAEVDRAGQVVTFSLPPEAAGAAALRDASGGVHWLQATGDGRVQLIVPWQRAGETLTFTVAPDLKPTTSGVRVAPEKGDLRVSVGDAPVLFYRLDRNALPRTDIKPEIIRAGYIHPVFSPAGQLVTDDYPSNHVHHHGIWTPWTKTSFQGRAPDFWNMQNKTGAEDLIAVDRTWDGPVHGGLEARLKMVDLTAPSPITALNETWRLTVYAIAGVPRPVRMFDLAVAQQCATNDPVILPKYHYGSFGLRGAGAWNGPGDAARFLTSEGVTDRIKGNDTRARWVYLGGRTPSGQLAGTTALGHPDNFRAPQPIRLHPDMPYFSYVPQQLGEFRIAPGETYRVRYRFIVADGEPDRALLDAYWNGYAQPAAVQVTVR